MGSEDGGGMTPQQKYDPWKVAGVSICLLSAAVFIAAVYGIVQVIR